MVEDAPGLLSPKVHDHLLALLRPEFDAPALVRVVAVVVIAVLLLLLAAFALALRLLAELGVVEGAQLTGFVSRLTRPCVERKRSC